MRRILVVLFFVSGILAAAQERLSSIAYVTDHAWSTSSATNLAMPGPTTLNLPVCPSGVRGDEPGYWVYLADADNSEAVKVTGGSCIGNSKPGTLQIATKRSHAAGYKIESASDGLQEALIAARIIPTNPSGNSQSGKIIVPPGEYKLHATVTVRASNQTIDFSGSILECYMDNPCIYVGDQANSNAVLDVTIVNPRGRPMLPNGAKPFIEVNGQKTRIYNVSARVSKTGTFGSYIQVDDDQAFLLDGLSTSLGYGVRCDETFCGSYVFAPGPFNKWSAVGWLKNLNISPQCGGNGIDWQSGNTLRVSDSVVQGYNQFGVRTGTSRGGYGPTMLDNVYMEAGNCKNKSGNIGAAGVIAQGQRVNWSGGEGPQGKVPLFAETGQTEYHYYVVPHNVKFGYGNPLYAGKAMTNGAGTITVSSPDITGADTFDLLRETVRAGARDQAPYGSGDFAVGKSITREAACKSGVCKFTDPQASLSQYTVPPVTYFPKLSYWPGDFVLGASSDSNSSFSGATLTIDSLSAQIVSVAGAHKPVVFASSCSALGNWTPAWIMCAAQNFPPSAFNEQGATIMAAKSQNDGGLRTNLKGRLNFVTLGTGPSHIITLSDSEFSKTVATANNRPSNDSDDAFIGYDSRDSSPKRVGISFGAPGSLSAYIGNVGDGENWKERLTADTKTFNVPVVIQEGSSLKLGGGTPISRVELLRVEIKGDRISPHDCRDIEVTVPTLKVQTVVSGLTPPTSLKTLTVTAYASNLNTLTAHFCNVGEESVSVPTGRYGFLAIQ